MSEHTDFVELGDRVTRLEGKTDRIDLSLQSVAGDVKKLLDRPSNPPIPQLIATGATLVTIVAAIFLFAEWRLEKAVAPLAEILVKMEQNQTKLQESSVQLRIRQAVIEERVANEIRERRRGLREPVAIYEGPPGQERRRGDDSAPSDR